MLNVVPHFHWHQLWSNKHRSGLIILTRAVIADAMLAQLRIFHADAIAATDALDDLLRASRPDLSTLSAARLRLMVTSRNRLNFLEDKIYPALLQRTPNAEILALREESRKRMGDAAGHIARWNGPEIERCWDEYTKAAKVIRYQVRRRIQAEIALLYPLLDANDRYAVARAT